jgi:hypothetical protein
MKNQSLKQQIINLVAEIKGWNEGDSDTSYHNGDTFREVCEVDSETCNERAKQITELEKLVLQIKD